MKPGLGPIKNQFSLKDSTETKQNRDIPLNYDKYPIKTHSDVLMLELDRKVDREKQKTPDMRSKEF